MWTVLDGWDLILVAGLIAGTGYLFYMSQAVDQQTRPDASSTSSPPLPKAQHDGKALKEQQQQQQQQTFKEGGLAQRVHKEKKDVVLFYGSQTGTAEGFAFDLAKTLQLFGISGLVIDPEDIHLEDLADLPASAICLFLVATYGDGEPTSNMTALSTEFSTASAGALARLTYALFGLGNKTYSQYNGAAKALEGALNRLGATALVSRGEGDADGMLEEDFAAWQRILLPSLCAALGRSFDAALLDRPFEPSFTLEWNPRVKPEKLFTGEIGHITANQGEKRSIYDHRHPYYAKINVAEEMVLSYDASEAPKSTFHIEFDIAEAKLKYQHGDHLAIFPENSPQDVQRMLTRLALNGDTVVKFVPIAEDDETAAALEQESTTKKKTPFPTPTKLITAFTSYVDIRSTVKRHVLRTLATYAADTEEQTALTEIVKGDTALYEEKVVKSSLNIMDLLDKYPSIHVPPEILLQLLPRIQCRFYSISSSPKSHPDAVHITVSVLRYHVRENELVEGLCTSFLHRLCHEEPLGGRRVGIYVRRSRFKLPRNKDSLLPIICVGAGSGVAPFRSFVLERSSLLAKGKKVGATHLFFGCRGAEKDFLYAKEWFDHVTSGALASITTAFSRDQLKKDYVQHRLYEKKELVWHTLDVEKGWFYICGDARYMARDVQATLLQIFQECGAMASLDEASAYLDGLRRAGRYHEDVWS